MAQLAQRLDLAQQQAVIHVRHVKQRLGQDRIDELPGHVRHKVLAKVPLDHHAGGNDALLEQMAAAGIGSRRMSSVANLGQKYLP